MRLLNLLIVVATAALGMIFASANPQSVKLDYYYGVIESPLALILVVTLVCGALLGMLGMGFNLMRLQRENSRLRRQMRLVQEELNNLRVVPIKDQ